MDSPLPQRLVSCGAVRFGTFTLTSGATSDYYVDVKAATTDPETLRQVAAQMAQLAKENGPFDAVAGMELGAIPIATAVSLQTGLPLLIIRKEQRGHGTGRQIEGSDPSGKRVFVVEDVCTTGGSTVDAVRILRDAGAVVEMAACVVDREEGAETALRDAGVWLCPLASASELLQLPEAREAAA